MLNSLSRTTAPDLTRDPFYRLMGSFFNQDILGGEEGSNRNWMPPVDIQETEHAYRLVAELPGLTKHDINITPENNLLRLSGDRKVEKHLTKDGDQPIE